MKHVHLSLFHVLTALTILATFPLSSLKATNLIIDTPVNDINGHGNAAGVRPGDTIFLKHGVKTYVWIAWLHGTPEKPIILMNSGGLVEITGFKYGLKFDSCSNIRISGNNAPGIMYGILIRDIVGAGLSVEGMSTGIEIEFLEIKNVTLAGIFAKSDPTCTNFSNTREKYMLRNLSIHHNYIHHTGMEGLYVGNVFYQGYTFQCNGKDTTVYPHLLRNIDIYENRIEYTAWDGIQVSSADSACRIRHNMIRYDSQAEKENQMSGIILGGGSRCDCYNNRIDSGKGDGIDMMSLGGQHIYNNLISVPGKNYRPGQNYTPYMKHGIYCGQYLSLPGTTNYIYNNTIISPKSYGIFVNNYVTAYMVLNNIIVDPGLYSQSGSQSYVKKADPSMNVTCNVNLFRQFYSEVNFVDPANRNFDITRYSPAVNNAVTIPGVDLIFDIDYKTRPFATFNDIGAFECHDSSLLSIPVSGNLEPVRMNLYSYPGSGQIIIEFDIAENLTARFQLFDLSGNLLAALPDRPYNPGIHKLILYHHPLCNGLYLVRCTAAEHSLSRKIYLSP